VSYGPDPYRLAGVACVLAGLIGLVLLAGPVGWPLALGAAVVAATVHLAARGDHHR
jgi:hypothetical protein